MSRWKIFLIVGIVSQLILPTTGETASEVRVLKEGLRGDDVAEIQLVLKTRGFLKGEADGVFGALTVEAVKKFQESEGLETDGIVGESTLKRLRETPTVANDAITLPSLGERADVGDVIKPGMYGEGVRQVQLALIEKGYLAGDADGVCGAMTTHAIRGFQKDAGLEPDGVVGAATYDALKGNVTAAKTGTRVVFVRATAYSAYDPGNSGRTATGKTLRRGIIAVDPSFIPLGTRVYIPGYGEAVAEDTGGNIKGNRIDVAFDSHEEAKSFGRKDLELYILEE